MIIIDFILTLLFFIVVVPLSLFVFGYGIYSIGFVNGMDYKDEVWEREIKQRLK